MAQTVWLIGGDVRSRYTAEALQAQGLEVSTCGVPECRDAPLPEVLEAAVLPFPSMQGRRLRGERGLPVEELLGRLRRGSRVFGGLLGIWKSAFLDRGAQVWDLYGAEPFTTANACLTAEGAVSLLMQSDGLAIQGAPCLIVGFGRIGKCLAQKLHGLGAEVTVSARAPSDLAMIDALGYQSEVTGQYRRGLSRYRYVLNTVPVEILCPAQLAGLPPECLLVELASAPGGFSAETCAALGLRRQAAPALPARYAPKTAGELYAQSILSILSQEEPT